MDDLLAAELATLPPEERALLEEIHRLRNELYAAELRLAALRQPRTGVE